MAAANPARGRVPRARRASASRGHSARRNRLPRARINGERDRRRLDEIVEHSLRQAALWDEVKNRLKASGLSLSGGQAQRPCIARTLAVEPDVVLMDEPCSALDPIATGAIEDLMRDIKSRYTIVIVTHAAGHARQRPHRLLLRAPQ